MGLSTRLLRLRRMSDATGLALESRLVLTFEYMPASGDPSGSFNRIVRIGGEVPPLGAQIFAAGSDIALVDDVVLSRGRSVDLELVISNLGDDDEPQPDDDITINYPQGQGLVIEQQEGILDAINRRYVLPLTVSLEEDATRPDYQVSINVRLDSRTARRQLHGGRQRSAAIHGPAYAGYAGGR